MQVALHVTKLRHSARASNRVSDRGGLCGREDSQVSLSKEDVYSMQPSPSTPEDVGKASKQRAGQRLGRGARAPKARNGYDTHKLACCNWQFILVLVATLMVVNLVLERELMIIIHISAAASVSVFQHASMQVALHVTKLRHSARASNRVSDRGGLCGREDSQVSLSKEDVYRFFRNWFGGNDTSCPSEKYVY